MAFSPDGSMLYAAVNGQNTVVAIDPVAGTVKQTFNTGIAPRQLKFVGTKLYVSNEGGRRAVPGEPAMNSYGTQVPADTVPRHLHHRHAQRHRHCERLGAGRLNRSPAAPDGDVPRRPRAVRGQHQQRHRLGRGHGEQQGRADHRDPAVGPVAGRLRADRRDACQGDHLLVSLGRANAIAVYNVNKQDPKDPASYIGLLPTDYYPENVAAVNGQIVVTNTRGIDARGPELSFDKGAGTTVATGHGTHCTTASLTRFTLPSDEQIQQHTATVFEQNGWNGSSRQAGQGSRGRARPGSGRPEADRGPVHDQARVPDRQGEPHLRPGLRRHEAGQR